MEVAYLNRDNFSSTCRNAGLTERDSSWVGHIGFANVHCEYVEACSGRPLACVRSQTETIVVSTVKGLRECLRGTKKGGVSAFVYAVKGEEEFGNKTLRWHDVNEEATSRGLLLMPGDEPRWIGEFMGLDTEVTYDERENLAVVHAAGYTGIATNADTLRDVMVYLARLKSGPSAVVAERAREKSTVLWVCGMAFVPDSDTGAFHCGDAVLRFRPSISASESPLAFVWDSYYYCSWGDGMIKKRGMKMEPHTIAGVHGGTHGTPEQAVENLRRVLLYKLKEAKQRRDANAAFVEVVEKSVALFPHEG